MKVKEEVIGEAIPMTPTNTKSTEEKTKNVDGEGDWQDGVALTPDSQAANPFVTSYLSTRNSSCSSFCSPSFDGGDAAATAAAAAAAGNASNTGVAGNAGNAGNAGVAGNAQSSHSTSPFLSPYQYSKSPSPAAAGIPSSSASASTLTGNSPNTQTNLRLPSPSPSSSHVPPARPTYFHSRRIKKGESERPWTRKNRRAGSSTYKPDPRDKWVNVIPLVGLLLGLVSAGLQIWDGVRRVERHGYCLVLDERFEGEVLDERVWMREVEVGGYGYVACLTWHGGLVSLHVLFV